MLRLPVLVSPLDAKQFPYYAAYRRDNANLMTRTCIRISEGLLGVGRKRSVLVSLRRAHLQKICLKFAGVSLSVPDSKRIRY